MSSLPPVRDLKEVPAAWDRFNHLPDSQKGPAVRQLLLLQDFQVSEEQFGQDPTAKDPKAHIQPHDIVFLLNWICVRPDQPIPPPDQRSAELRDQIWQQIKDKYGPSEGAT